MSEIPRSPESTLQQKIVTLILLENCSEKLFDTKMQNYLNKLKIIWHKIILLYLKIIWHNVSK